MDKKPKIKPARDVVIELQFENEALRAENERLHDTLPCGHPRDCTVTADDFANRDGTGYCGWCAALVEAERLREQARAVVFAYHEWQDGLLNAKDELILQIEELEEATG